MVLGLAGFEGAEVFEENAALKVVAAELTDASDFLKPQRAQLGGGGRGGVGVSRHSEGLVFAGDRRGEIRGVRRFDGGDDPAGDVDDGAAETFFRPVDGAGGFGGGRGDIEGFRTETIFERSIRGGGDGPTRDPRDGHAARLRGEDALSVRAIIKSRNRTRRHGGVTSPSRMNEDLARFDSLRPPIEAVCKEHPILLRGGRRDGVAEQVARDAAGKGATEGRARDEDRDTGRYRGAGCDIGLRRIPRGERGAGAHSAGAARIGVVGSELGLALDPRRVIRGIVGDDEGLGPPPEW